MQILEGRVEQNRQSWKGRWQIKYYSAESSKIASCMLAHFGWTVWYGSEVPKVLININSTEESTETKLMFDTLVQMGLKPLFLVHWINVLKWIWSKYWWGYEGFQYRNYFNIQISECTHLTSLITNCTLFLKVIPG